MYAYETHSIAGCVELAHGPPPLRHPVRGVRRAAVDRSAVPGTGPNQIGDGLAAYYSQGLQINVFGITFLLAGLLAGPAINDQKRAKCSYTWLTMPLSPAARLAAQVLTAAVLLLGIVALQLVLYAVYSVPVHLFENFVLAQQERPYSVQMLFYEEVIRSGGIYWMIPRRLGR